MNKLSFLGLLIWSASLSAQELSCRVIVNAQAINSMDSRNFTEMEVAFSEFLNNTKWTSDEFKI